jgi:CO/xanthine dehydrogenase FAD-binding subunit
MAAADAAVAGAKPMSGNAYKIQLARTAVKRALLRAARA